MKPQRIQLSRRKGWRMPPNTVKVDRTTRWGNPFIVGAQGNAAECVYWFGMLLGGYLLLDCKACTERQEAALELFKAEAPHWRSLRGKNLACWCKAGQPCHADLLLHLANRKRREPLDLLGFLKPYGWTIVNGRAEKVAA